MRTFALLLATSVGLTACLGSDFDDSIQGSWQLVSGTVDATQIPIIDTHPITLTIEDDRIGGIAACNSYGGQGTVSPFNMGELSSTEMACFPEETMEAEALYLDAFSRVDDADLDPPRLILTGPSVRLEYDRLEPVPTAELQGTVWVLDGLVRGDAVTSVSGERATLELFSDGSFIGSTGCRDISGTYVIAGAEVQFTNFGANGECPTDLQPQDSHVISSLEGGFRVEIDGDHMTTWTSGDEGLTYRAES